MVYFFSMMTPFYFFKIHKSPLKSLIRVEYIFCVFIFVWSLLFGFKQNKLNDLELENVTNGGQSSVTKSKNHED